MKSIINTMNKNGCLALLLNKWKPSLHGSQSLGFPPPNNPLPIHTALSIKVFSTSYPNTVDLVKLDLVSMQMSSFTLEGVKSSSNDDPLSYYEGFYSCFYYAWASLPNYSSPKWNQQNLIFQFTACKFWNITLFFYFWSWFHNIVRLKHDCIL